MPFLLAPPTVALIGVTLLTGAARKNAIMMMDFAHPYGTPFAESEPFANALFGEHKEAAE